MKKLLLSFFVLAVFTFTTKVFSQAVGDYGTGVTPGTWTTINNWLVCVTPGTWVGATTATAIPSTATNVWIRNGYTMTIPGSGTINCKDVKIENNGILNSSNAVTSPRYLKIYGNLTNDGNFGSATDGLGLGVNDNCIISGSGTTYISRVQPQAASKTITFDADVAITYTGSTVGTGSSGIYCNANATVFTINSAKTVTLIPESYFAVGTSGSGEPGSGANFTLNVYGTLTLQAGNNSHLNLSNKTGFTSILNVYSTGVLNLGRGFYAVSAGTPTINVNIDAGAQVNFTGTGGTCNASKSITVLNGTLDFNNIGTSNRDLGSSVSVSGTIKSKYGILATLGTITLNTGSTVEFYGTSATTLGTFPTAYSNLIINNSGGVTLDAALTISNLFSIVSGAFVDLSSYNHTSEYLKLAGVDQTPGTHGSTASSATYQNSTYFGSSATGILTVNGALPVELSSFIANAKNGLVQLSWRTISETNSLTFAVQRKSENSEWTKIGEVTAAGNSNSPKDYNFIDKNSVIGKYQYRLQMIDADGSYEYSNVVEAEITQPSQFLLAQNYPNPFNPSTTINYSLPADSRVTLELYSLIGEKVADLVNESQASGFYSYNFNTSNLNLTSGVYLYKLTAVSNSNEVFSQSMKMLLLK